MESYSSESLQQRLAVGLGNKGGARGSLTRCAGRLGSLKRALEDEDNNSNNNNSDPEKETDNAVAAGNNNNDASPPEATMTTTKATAELLSRELQLAHIEMTKLLLMARRQEVELEQLRGNSIKNLTEKFAMERITVDRLRQGLQQASSTVACQREYELLAKLASSRHPTARRVLQEQMDQVQAQLEQTNRDFKTATAHVEIRERQFQLLIQCMLDLKQSLSEPLEQLDDYDNDIDDGQVAGGHRATKITTTSGSTDTAMEGVEKTSGADDNDEEEGALYDDL